ncbi:MAG: OmpA family protein [Xanthomonadales bacterium]|nr:OmpA family protein [Xanthomonadales bacterium]
MNAMRIHDLARVTAVALLAAVLASACASRPVVNDELVEARQELTDLENDPRYAGLARLAVEDAEVALERATRAVNDRADNAAHLVYLAQRRVDIAQARARTAYAERQAEALEDERHELVLASREAEADRARSQAELARERAEAEAAAARAERLRAEEALMAEQRARRDAEAAAAEAEAAREVARLSAAEAEAARREAEAAAAAAEALRIELDALASIKAEQTERGLVVTLGDVLFDFDRSDLKPAARDNLSKLVDFLREYEDRGVEIEGHTDSVGTEAYNIGLSQRRAAAVERYLLDNGIEHSRIETRGLGEEFPVASNETDSGRAQNRRVEIIIENPQLTGN